MPTLTPNLGLKKPLTTEPALIGDLNFNTDALDALLAGSSRVTVSGQSKLLLNGQLAIGPSGGDASSHLVVTHAYAPPTVGAVMADFGLDTTSSDPASDQGAVRAVARQAVSGQTLLRAIETHVVRDGAASAAGTWAQEVGVHSKVAGDGSGRNVGVRIDSSHTGWLAGAGARNDSGVLVLGEDGWVHGFRYLDTDASVLFDVDQLGKITARALVLAYTGAIVDFSGQATGAIRGGTVGLTLQSNDGLNANVSVSDAGSVTVRNSVITPALTVTTTLLKGAVPLNQVLHGSLAANTVPLSITHYAVPGVAAPGATENTRQMVIPRAGTLRNLYLVTSTAQPASGTLIATVRKNGVDTAVTLTVAANAAAGAFSDLTHAVAVAAGDLISVGLVNAATAASATLTSLGMTLDA